jgi:hypothetical protein
MCLSRALLYEVSQLISYLCNIKSFLHIKVDVYCLRYLYNNPQCPKHKINKLHKKAKKNK